jgi:hypothetical protein
VGGDTPVSDDDSDLLSVLPSEALRAAAEADRGGTGPERLVDAVEAAAVNSESVGYSRRTTNGKENKCNIHDMTYAFHGLTRMMVVIWGEQLPTCDGTNQLLVEYSLRKVRSQPYSFSLYLGRLWVMDHPRNIIC